ncbi:hypothetical protein [Treponema berlinense]|uniref:hypothetical protein n=1 Tax=Treponema berlinense TaxID=225004 RepID=UPI003F0D56C2
MIKAEMLNEMNPKLRALLAAGLIGTAGLGATSCSTPNDDYEEPAIEQPATPETPGSTTETPAETENTKEMDTAEETTDATFKAFKLEVTPEEAKSLARARRAGAVKDQINLLTNFDSYIYKDGFSSIPFTKENTYSITDLTYIRYADLSDHKMFYVPAGSIEIFDSAIAAYNAIHNK